MMMRRMKIEKLQGGVECLRCEFCAASRSPPMCVSVSVCGVAIFSRVFPNVCVCESQNPRVSPPMSVCVCVCVCLCLCVCV